MRWRWPWPARVGIAGGSSWRGLESQVFRQMVSAPGAILRHRIERAPGFVIQNRFIHSAEAVLDALLQWPLHLTPALVAKFLPTSVFNRLAHVQSIAVRERPSNFNSGPPGYFSSSNPARRRSP